MRLKIKKKKKLCTINKSLRTVAIIAAVMVFLSTSYILYFMLNKHSVVDKKISVYSYSHKAIINYSISQNSNANADGVLQNNPKSVGEGNIYVADWIDSINPTFTYEFNGDKTAEISGSYEVLAEMDGVLSGDKSSKVVWEKKDALQSKTNFNVKDNKYAIPAPIQKSINFKAYKEDLRKIMQAANINFDAKLTVYWNIHLQVKTDKGTIEEDLSPTMEIPLNSNYFEIGGNLSQQKNGDIEEAQKITVPVNKNEVILSAIGMLLSIVALVFLLIFTTNSMPEDPLKKKLKNIFKEHGNRLVALRNNMNITDETTINAADIEDLVRVADEISKPILYKHSEDINEITQFYIIDEKIIYLYDVEEALSKTLFIDENRSESQSLQI